MVPLKRKFLTVDANDVRELRENLLKMNKNGSKVISHRKLHHITLLTFFFFSSFFQCITYKFISYHNITFYLSSKNKIDSITYKLIKKKLESTYYM